jgi:hypothetical protein
VRMAQYVRIALRGVVMWCDKHWQIFSTCALSPGFLYSLEVMRLRRNNNIICQCARKCSKYDRSRFILMALTKA